MDNRPVGQILRYLRRLAVPVDGCRLDAKLLERFVTSQDGNGAAFSRLVERHSPLVLGVCRRVLQNHHEAEDAFQATFLVLARKARHICKRDALGGWLYKVARHYGLETRTAVDVVVVFPSGRVTRINNV